MEKFNIHILGCGSALPTTRHQATSQVLNIREKLFMIDCGEGAQVQLRRAKLKFSRLNHIFISHLHSDHCFGLMGLISTFGMLERTADLHIHAHADLQRLLEHDMHGKTAGIVGTGKIARALIRILRGFGMEVLGYDPCPDEAFARESGMTYVPLTELYRRSDIISLHCPLTDRTLHMIDAEAIGQMKDGVIIINTGRGQLIRTSDLIEGLKEKKIGAAGLDVYEEEADYFYQDTSDRIMDDDMLARLLSFNNVILTSHQGFFTREALDNIARTTLENIQAFSHGECLNEVKYK